MKQSFVELVAKAQDPFYYVIQENQILWLHLQNVNTMTLVVYVGHKHNRGHYGLGER